nr:SCP2 domain-containing protein [Rhizobium sp. TCK]
MMKIPSYLSIPIQYVPVPILERATRTVFRKVLAEHPDLFQRLGPYRQKRFAFRPTDLPVAFIVNPSLPSLSVIRKTENAAADCTIEATIIHLLALLEGRCDADALFFAREITVTGDMEAMLALRNALDDSLIDLPTEIGKLGGPFGSLLRRAAYEIRERVLPREQQRWN